MWKLELFIRTYGDFFLFFGSPMWIPNSGNNINENIVYRTRLILTVVTYIVELQAKKMLKNIFLINMLKNILGHLCRVNLESTLKTECIKLRKSYVLFLFE